MSQKYNWLNRRGNVWQFRRRVKPEIQHLIGKTEITISLKTGHLKTAKQLYPSIAADVQSQFDEAFSKLEISKPQHLPVLIAEKLAKDWFNNKIPEAINEARNSLGMSGVDEEIENHKINYLMNQAIFPSPDTKNN